MSSQPATENTPLLDPEDASSPSTSNGLAKRALAFRIATTASLATGVLTIILLSVVMVLLSGAPPTYSPPYQIYYTLSPVAGFAAIACLHSGLVLLDGAPLRGSVAGILVDVFAGFYFLFESLYGMQQFLGESRYGYGYTGCRTYDTPPPLLDECRKWRAHVVPVIWTYLFVTLALGLVHVLLLFLRTVSYTRGRATLRVVLIGEDGTAIRR